MDIKPELKEKAEELAKKVEIRPELKEKAEELAKKVDIRPELKEKAEELAQKMKVDKDLAARFQKEPVKVLEQLLGRDLPDEKLRDLGAGLKERLGLAPKAEQAPEKAAPEQPEQPEGRLADAQKRAAMKKHK